MKGERPAGQGTAAEAEGARGWGPRRPPGAAARGSAETGSGASPTRTMPEGVASAGRRRRVRRGERGVRERLLPGGVPATQALPVPSTPPSWAWPCTPSGRPGEPPSSSRPATANFRELTRCGVVCSVVARELLFLFLEGQ